MKNLLYLLLPILFFTACSDGEILEKQIIQLIENEDLDQIKTVKDKLLAWEGTPEELGEKTRVVAEFLRSKERLGEALLIMKHSLKNHPEKESKQTAELLAKFYEENMKKPVQASLIRQSISGQPKEEGNSVHDQIKKIGRDIFADESKGFNRQIAQEFLNAVENLAMVNPSDEGAPNFLIDGATIARNLGDNQRTLELFRWVYEKFPNHPKAADAMFYEGFTYDSDLKDMEKAKVAYEAFMTKYPNHAFVEQAKIMVANLGKTDEELLESLEAQ